eukprot:scaffold175613_cov17-Prasinocladus_malaysianus.AAC.1
MITHSHAKKGESPVLNNILMGRIGWVRGRRGDELQRRDVLAGKKGFRKQRTVKTNHTDEGAGPRREI